MSRPPKRARKTPDNDCADRITALPDAILCHILSFLDTKYAVATSVLSTRWKDLFISVPNIVLDDCLTWKTRNKSVSKFARFSLRQIMIRNVPHIDQFRLKCHFRIKDPAIQTLVRAAISRNVREVDIWVENPKYAGELPHELYTPRLLVFSLEKRKFAGILLPELFTSRSLVVLKLRGELDLGVLELVSLPNLKVLLLDSLILPSDDSISRLFRGCKLLEDLSLCRCSFVRVDVLDISIPSLRKLSFNIGDSPVINFIFEHSIQGAKLVIDTPNLEFFEYRGQETEFHFVKELKSLARAEISFISKVQGRDKVSEFINKMRGVKSLYLSYNAAEAMYPSCSSLCVFGNLTLLELGFFNLRRLPSILESAPQLEQLVILKDVYDGNHDFLQEEAEALYSLRETVPMCLTKHLRNIEFKEFAGSKFGFELVKYLLENGKVLERMKLLVSCTLSGCKEISTFPRCSETCEIVIEYVLN